METTITICDSGLGEGLYTIKVNGEPVLEVVGETDLDDISIADIIQCYKEWIEK